MSFRFIHTADWQLGMQAKHVASAAAAVRQERLNTARRIVDLAQAEKVDCILIAGDLFENNAIGNELIYQTLHILEDAAPIPIFILPGNHDYLGPASVYARECFTRLPSHITVLRDCVPCFLPGGQAVLLPAPLNQPRSGTDPTGRLPFVSEPVLKIGVTHGSPSIPGKFQPDDHPIALDAAGRIGLDYLALGHWHSWQQFDERTVMPGTPEPTSFGEDSGYVALVELEYGRPPKIKRIPVGGLQWIEYRETVEADAESLRAKVEHRARNVPNPQKTLVRLRVDGFASADVYAALDDLRTWLSSRFLFADIDNSQLSPLMSAGQLREQAAKHPNFAGILSDLIRISLLIDPEEPVEETDLELGTTLPDEILRQIIEEQEVSIEVVQEALRQLGRLAAEVNS